MSRRMPVGILVPALVCMAFGNGMISLLPLYALKVGASRAVAGWYSAFSFLCLTAGALLAGINWLAGGLLLTGINIIASRSAAENERGRIFGMIGVTVGAASIIGGLGIGTLVDRFGYPTMFAVIAGCYLLVPAVLMLLPRAPVERVADAPGPEGSPAAARRIGAAALLFVGALVTLPVPFVLGRLSDPIGRRTVLVACTACGAGSLVILIASRVLWHFWFIGVLLAMLGVSVSIGQAFVADLVPPAGVNAVMSVFQAA